MGARSRVVVTARRVRALDPALLLLAAMVFVVQVGVAVMLPLLPLYALSLGASPFVLGLLTSTFAVTNAAGQLVTGFLGQRLPMRRLLAAGIGSYALANFLIAGASTAGGLVAFRAFAGVGGGVMIVGERLYLAQLVDRTRLGFANGVLSAAGSAGSVTGPAIGGLLASLADLRLPFLLVGVTSLLATVGALFLPRARNEQAVPTPEEAPAPEEAPTLEESDAPATTEAAEAQAEAQPDGLAEGQLPYDVHASADDQPATVSDQPATVSDQPEHSDLRRLGILLLAQLGLMSGFGSFITTYGPFAGERLGWTTAEIGLVFALFGLGAILLGPWLGRQADLHGRRDVAIGAAIPIVVFAVVYWLEAPRPLLYLASIAAGAGVTGVSASWYALLADATDGGRRSGRFGAVAALGNLGIVLGATLTAQLWETLADVSIGFVIAAISVSLCGVAFALYPSDRRAGPAPAT